MHSADDLMKLADEAIHAYAAWLAESITINEPGNHPDILIGLNEKKDAARRKLEVAIRAACGVGVPAPAEPVAVRVREVFAEASGRWRYFDWTPGTEFNARPTEEMQALYADGVGVPLKEQR
jgi:hypothetical protein